MQKFTVHYYFRSHATAGHKSVDLEGADMTDVQEQFRKVYPVETIGIAAIQKKIT